MSLKLSKGVLKLEWLTGVKHTACTQSTSPISQMDKMHKAARDTDEQKRYVRGTKHAWERSNGRRDGFGCYKALARQQLCS